MRSLRTLVAGLMLVASVLLAAGAGGAQEGQAGLLQFYEQNPQWQDFYPFGVYGGDPGNWAPFGVDPQLYTQVMTDLLAGNGFNVIWGPGLHRDVELNAQEQPVGLSAYGKWYFGEELPFHELRILPTFTNVGMRYNSGALGRFKRNEPLLNAAEMAEVEKDRHQILSFAHDLAKAYPQTVIGTVSDDEPEAVAPAVAAIRLLEQATGLPCTTCIPSWGAFKAYVPYLQPITGDWYVNGDNARNNWDIARHLQWVRENYPESVCFFLPLATAYPGGHEATKPWLKDSRPSRTELRAQFWMAIAGGAKAFFYYHPGGWPEWAGGEDTILNPLLKPNNDLWDEMGALAKDITAIGPLLLSCRPEIKSPVSVTCGAVRFPEFQGPAIECGVLRDLKHDRLFLVPRNNDVDKAESGALVIPAGLLAGRKLYDLAALKEAAPGADGRLAVDFPPGGGKILLLAAPAEFAACRETILRHRVSYPRVLAKMRLRGSLGAPAAEALMTQAKTAEVASDWLKAADLYEQAVAAVDDAEKKARVVAPTHEALDRVAGVLGESDKLLRCYRHLFDIPASQALHYSHVPDKYLGKQIRDWVALTTLYFASVQQARAGRYWDYTVYDNALSLEQWAQANKAEIQAAVDRRLAEVRKPLKVAFVTPNRDEVEYHMDYSWAFEHCLVTWIAPDGKGKLVDEAGKPFNPGDYQVVWVHQLRYARVPAEGQTPDPAQVLMPELTSPATLTAIKGYVEGGGGLVLSGIAGLAGRLLGVEAVMPNRVRENSFFSQSFGVGLAAAPGFEKHPLFTGLPASGFFTNASFPELNLITEAAWEKLTPSGRVVANEYDDLFGRIGEYAAIVEYAPGKGKVIALAGRACDFTPGIPFSLKGETRESLRDHFRQLVLNALVYCGGAPRFAPDERAAAAPAAVSAAPDILLPLEGWLFRTDPQNVGMKAEWFRPGLDTQDWKPIRVGTNWESQGYDYDGYAWYRVKVTLGNREGKRTMLHFGAVDEEAVVYLDGKPAGKHQEGLEGWDKPFALDITPLLGPQPEEHLLSVQVHDQMAAGGIWKPVFVKYE